MSVYRIARAAFMFCCLALGAARLHYPATATGPLTLHWQGCAEAGICYPPQTMQISAVAAEAADDGGVGGQRAQAHATSADGAGRLDAVGMS